MLHTWNKYNVICQLHFKFLKREKRKNIYAVIYSNAFYMYNIILNSTEEERFF